MKKLFLIFILFLVSFLSVEASDLTKIKCKCLYGEKITENYKTHQIISRDTSLLNKQSIYYFYIDNNKKAIYDSENRKRKTITFNTDDITIFDVTNLSNGITNAEIWKIERNTGYIEGSIVFEQGNIRITTSVYGECSIIENTNKF